MRVRFSPVAPAIYLKMRKKSLYQQDPKRCKACSKEIDYNKRNNTFCSSSCSATYNNKQRDPEFYAKHSDLLKQKKLATPKIRYGVAYASYDLMVESYRQNPSFCKNCTVALPYSRRSRKTCGKACSIEYRSALQKQRIKDNPSIHPNVLCSKLRNKRSFAEVMLEDYLIELGLRKDIDFIPQFGISKYLVDFYLPKSKTVLEVNGRFWHDLESEREVARTQKLEEEGCKVYHFWADKITRKEYHTDIQALIASVV